MAPALNAPASGSSRSRTRGASEIGRFATYYRRNSRIGKLEAPMTLVGKGSHNAPEDAPDATDAVSNR